MARSEFEFTLVIDGDLTDGDIVDRLHDAGCDNATFGSVDGVGFGDFHREAGSFLEAVLQAIGQVEQVSGLRVLHVEPDDLVTMADAAGRLGKSREYVRLLVGGRRGRGGFPAPISHLGGRSRLWRWSEVAAWAGLIDEEEQRRAKAIAAVNAALELSRSGLGKRERDRLLKAVAV
ncbi:MAG: hypothetical protein WDA71_04065 [Actinomycetota bacterium]